MAQTYVTRHQGFPIYSCEDGFFWENGCDGGGYFVTLEETREDIADYNDSFNDYDPVDIPQDAMDAALDAFGPWGAP